MSFATQYPDKERCLRVAIFIGEYPLKLIPCRKGSWLHVGSSPSSPTMEISEYYKSKGFVKVYVNTNKEPRRVATLRKENGEMTSMSYAKYLYTSHYKCDIPKGFQVDHINNDRMDDRTENLQILSQKDNNAKGRKPAKMLKLTCPICGKEFQFKKSNLNTHPNPCCSRKCGGKKSHLTLSKKLIK